MTIDTRFMGRTADGDRVHITVEFRELDFDPPRETTNHEKVHALTELSISGIVTAKHCREPWGGGQIIDSLAAVTEPAKGLSGNDITRIVAIWHRWHLNGMQAACAHQTVVWEDSDYGRRPSLDLTPVCPESGYRYGHAWLVEALPEKVRTELEAILAKAPRHH